MIVILQLLSALAISAIIVCVLIPAIVKVSKLKNLFDVPNERKVNKVVIPNLGGIAIFIGTTVSVLLAINKLPFVEIRSILACMIILLFVGIKDDILVLSARKKFIIQILCASILIVWGGIRFTNLHGILGLYEVNYAVSFLITIAAIVGLINAYNLIDGIDGLAASLGVLATLTFGTLFYLNGALPFAILSFSISGSLIAFFFYNVFGKKNKIFMGDTGSLLVGLLVSVFVIKYNELAITMPVSEYLFAPALTLAIVAIPLFDMIRVFSLRLSQGKSPFFPDMNHIHHKLLKLGLSHISSTIILFSINLAFIGLAHLVFHLDNTLQVLILLSVAIVISTIPGIILQSKANRMAKQKISFPKKSRAYLSFSNINLSETAQRSYLFEDTHTHNKQEEPTKEEEPEYEESKV